MFRIIVARPATITPSVATTSAVWTAPVSLIAPALATRGQRTSALETIITSTRVLWIGLLLSRVHLICALAISRSLIGHAQTKHSQTKHAQTKHAQTKRAKIAASLCAPGVALVPTTAVKGLALAINVLALVAMSPVAAPGQAATPRGNAVKPSAAPNTTPAAATMTMVAGGPCPVATVNQKRAVSPAVASAIFSNVAPIAVDLDRSVTAATSAAPRLKAAPASASAVASTMTVVEMFWTAMRARMRRAVSTATASRWI